MTVLFVPVSGSDRVGWRQKVPLIKPYVNSQPTVKPNQCAIMWVDYSQMFLD
jgi:hypothetical protein